MTWEEREIERKQNALRERAERAERRLCTTLDQADHWRARAIAAEQALGLYGPRDSDPADEGDLDLLDAAWGLLSSFSEPRWDELPLEWRHAMIRWRQQWNRRLRELEPWEGSDADAQRKNAEERAEAAEQEIEQLRAAIAVKNRDIDSAMEDARDYRAALESYAGAFHRELLIGPHHGWELRVTDSVRDRALEVLGR